MSRVKLFLIEAPGKEKTIQKYLGSDYKVMATKGHISDLTKDRKQGLQYGINTADWKGVYEVSEEKKSLVQRMKKAAKEADEVIIATDLDREGEAIGWAVVEELGIQNKYTRIVYSEITKKAILEALKSPAKLNMDLVYAQQARRFLDRLVGFEMSPILWGAYQKGLSAGRVQSVVVKMIVDRQRAIKDFKPEEYWTVKLGLKNDDGEIEAVLKKINGDKAEVPNSTAMQEVQSHLDAAAYTVTSLTKKPKPKNPDAPFITSSFQTAAMSKLKIAPTKSMQVAQILYEKGAITYMRTDCPAVAKDFQDLAIDYIKNTYGDNYAPKVPHKYKSKGAAQEAHECIRPSSLDVSVSPDQISAWLKKEGVDQKNIASCARVYKLIWDRFIASQMAAAIFDTANIVVKGKDGDWVCEGSVTGRIEKFDGYLKVYKKDSEEEDEADGKSKEISDEVEGVLPEMKAGDALEKTKIIPKKNFTKPPASYTLATIVSAMEKKQIGRPATTGGILSTIQARKYVEETKGKLVSTELGEKVTDILVDNFPAIIDYDFSKNMESDLDKIARGKIRMEAYMQEFWPGFHSVAEVCKDKYRVKVEEIDIGEKCPICEGALFHVKRAGKEWIGCENRKNKTCTFARNVDQEINQEKKCPKCGHDLYKKKSKKGFMFWSCSAYPKCDFIESAEPKVYHKTEKCPNCGKGLVKKKGKYGDFYSCEGYPDCKFILKEKKEFKKVYHKTEKCPNCGKGLLKKKGKYGDFYSCEGYPECKFILKNDKKK